MVHRERSVSSSYALVITEYTTSVNGQHPARRCFAKALRLCRYLAVAAATSVIVSLAAAIWCPLTRNAADARQSMPSTPGIQWYEALRPSYQMDGFGYTLREHIGRDRGFDDNGNILGGCPSFVLIRAGWPLYQFSGYYANVPPFPGSHRTTYISNGLLTLYDEHLFPYPYTERTIPVRPIVTGLVLNTAIWLGVELLILATVRFLVLRHRKRTRRCIVCGQSIIISGRCQECGHEAE